MGESGKMNNFLWNLIKIFYSGGLSRRFISIFYIIAALCVGVIGYVGYSSASSAYINRAIDLVEGYTAETASKITTFQELVRNDLRFFGGYQPLLRYLYWQDLNDPQKMEHWGNLTLNMMEEFIKYYSHHYKISFIDNSGIERLSVVQDLTNNEAKRVQKGDLQNFKKEEFFQKGMELKTGEFFASSVTFVLKNGEIQKPYIPIIRFVSPVIGKNGTRYGVMVVNVLASTYFDFIKQVASIDSSREFFLIDKEGEYFYNKDSSKTFGSTLGHGANFNKDFPGVMGVIEENEGADLANIGKIISIEHIRTNMASDINSLYLIGTVDEQVALADLRGFIIKFVSVVSAIIVLVLLLARYYVRGVLDPLLFVTRQLQKLGRGEIGVEYFEYKSKDEISIMLDSTSKMLINMERLANEADIISKGDFSRKVPMLSENDRLGIALNNMTEMLQRSKIEDERNNWLKDGINRLSSALTGDLSPENLASIAIGICGRYVEAGRGVFYIFDKEGEALELLGSYMFSERESLNNRFKIGEGAVGQVALERKEIILHAPSQTPILTGTQSINPMHTYTYPLIREGELLGVIELASYEKYDELKLEYIKKASEIMASFLYVVNQQAQVKKLLIISEDAKKEALEQSRRLQETNTQMEEQQQQLMQQSEELQQANAQMEEQQQLLMQQSEELKNTNDSLLKIQDELKARAEELEQTNRYKSEFLANMSHELRTPLNSIILLSKMLAHNDHNHLNEDEIKKCKIINDAGNELLRLINDILDLSKIEAGRMDLHLEKLDISEISENMSDLFSSIAKSKGVNFILEDDLLDGFVTDKDKLSQILRNLLSNSFKFTKTGYVTLRFSPSNNDTLPIQISVIDTGIGIPKEKIETIFEAFKQVDGSITREYGGTGLGLSIVKAYVELLGGKIEVYSEDGGGSEFRLLFPKTLKNIHPGKPKSEKKTELFSTSTPAPKVKNSKSVLIIEDDRYFAKIIEGEAKKLGLSPKIANSGNEAMGILSSETIDAFVMDLGLPDVDGVELLQKIRGNKKYAATPVYIISARDKGDEEQFNINGFLHKPVDVEQIDSALNSLFGFSGGEILIVEDDEIYLDAVCEYLSKNMKIKTKKAKNSEEALRILEGGGLSAVILDLKLGECDGRELCRKIHSLYQEMPIIIYTALELSEAEELSLKRCAQSIIIKKEYAEKRMAEELKLFLQEHSDTQELKSYIHTDKKSHLGGEISLEGRSVLIVDDDARNIYAISSALQRGGCKVYESTNGKEALKMIDKQPIDLVLMDIMMPEMDGYETIKNIRKDSRFATLPIIALTAKALKEDKEKCLSAGADDYLSKPVDYDVLISLVGAWIEKKHADTSK